MLIEMGVVTLLVWNVHGLPFPKLTKGVSSKKIYQALKPVDYDLLLAQEVWTKGIFKKIYKAHKELTYSRRANRAGLAMFAEKGKVSSYKSKKFKYTTFSRGDWLALKGFQSAVINLGGTTTLLINTHLDAGKDFNSSVARLTQLRMIKDYVENYNFPVIIAGDLNLHPYSPESRALLSWFSNSLDLKIAVSYKTDYVLTSKTIRLVDTHIFKPGVANPSDHAMISVTLK